MINCSLCEMVIVKYKMDLGDTVFIDVPNIQTGIGTIEKYICDNCARTIAKQLIER